MINKSLKILAFLLLCSCGDDESEHGDLELSFYERAGIADDYPYVEEGTNVVFHRFFRADDEPDIADDEYAEDFMIEIDGSQEFFEVAGDELADLKVLLNQYCFCAPTELLLLTGGFIRGEKRGEVWDLDVDVNFRQGYINPETNDTIFFDTENKTFSGAFRPKVKP